MSVLIMRTLASRGSSSTGSRTADPVEKTERDIATLAGQISSGEIKLPEIQRGYVWKPTQVAKLVEFLYRGYPSGLYCFGVRARHVETETFQNQSAATAKDPRWIKVYDVLRDDADLFELRGQLLEAGVPTESRTLGRRLNQLAAIPKHRFHVEILSEFPYDEVAQIFVRVNSGGRSLRTTDLALATLSARWPGVVGKLEAEADHWAQRGYGDLDVTFLTRALTGAVLGRGLSAWSHARLVKATDDELGRGWATVRRGLRHLVPLLRENLKVSHSSLLPSVGAAAAGGTARRACR